MARHENKLRGNQRLTYVYSSWDKMTADKQRALRLKAVEIFRKLEDNALSGKMLTSRLLKNLMPTSLSEYDSLIL